MEVYHPVFLSDICQITRCLVACCVSEVIIKFEDVTDIHEEENAKEEEENKDPKSDGPSFTEEKKF